MEKKTKKMLRRSCRQAIALAVLTAAVQTALPAHAGQNNFGNSATTGSPTPGTVTISTGGSTALKNWFVKTPTFTDVTPGTYLTIAGVTYPQKLTTQNDWATNGGRATAFQLALSPPLRPSARRLIPPTRDNRSTRFALNTTKTARWKAFSNWPTIRSRRFPM